MRTAGLVICTILFALGIAAYALRWLWVAMIAVAMLLYAYAAARAEEMVEPTPEEAADIMKWIPAFCCRTNNCCRKVHESALIALPNNQIRVRTTGQVLPRTGWSQDKNTWRCACDFNAQTNQWDVHPNANTRCVFDHAAAY